MSYNEIGILLGASAIVLIFLVRNWAKTPYLKAIWKSSLLLFALYVTVLVIVEIRWHFISEHAKSFDLNGNGFVDLEEYTDTEEAMEALNRVTQDTAKNFAFITGAILSATSSAIFLSLDLLFTYRKSKKESKNP